MKNRLSLQKKIALLHMVQNLVEFFKYKAFLCQKQANYKKSRIIDKQLPTFFV